MLINITCVHNDTLKTLLNVADATNGSMDFTVASYSIEAFLGWVCTNYKSS